MPAPITFTCPLPPEALRFESMQASLAVSALESIELTLVADKADVAAEKLLGKHAGVVMTLPEGGKRYFNGIVARFGMGRAHGRNYQYQATLKPWLWFLTRTSDCRIFQEMTVPEIVEKVFADHSAIANFELKLSGSYRKRVYCVQYRETDFNFVARLMEEEGIYWFFDHSEGMHKLMLVDDMSALEPCKGAEELPFHDIAGQAPPNFDYVSGWTCHREVRTGKAALTSYDFERPSTTLLVEHALARSHDLDDYEQFDYNGEYTQKPDGQHLADNQLEEQQSRFERASGATTARGLAAGHLFKIARHPRADQNAEHLCLQATVSARIAAHEAGTGSDDYHCQFTAMPSAQAFRSERRTPKPFVQGPQTAVVVGPSGEEIFTDKYGRVKVQFHWDRYGKKNETSSCWVRVSSPWAGKSFGFVQIPRIGQEVVVNFLEGDPDQPLITGRVYNAEQMPPWELPANATQSGVLTRSSKGGSYGNANAIRFEDKKGSEQLWIHAEMNMDIEVENDETHWVGHDRKKTIDNDETTLVKHDRTETVGHDETITIGNNRTETVAVNETISIGSNRTETVGSNETITIGSNRTISVGGSETATVALQRTHAVGVNESIAIGAAQEVAIGAAQVIAVGANQSTSVGVNQSTSVGSNRTVEVGKDQSHKIGANRSADVAKDDALKVGKNLVIDAGDSVTIKTGSSSITMKKDGTITIKGKDITIDGSGKINVKASSDIVMKGSKILQTEAMHARDLPPDALSGNETPVTERTAAADLLAPLLNAPATAQPPAAGFGPGVVIGELLALQEGPVALVRYAGQPGTQALRAATTVDLHGAHIGVAVVLAFEQGDPHRPVVLGVVQGTATWPLPEPPAQVQVDADGQRLVVHAREQLVLRCGKASITLTKAGKVLIEGSYVLSRSSGVNRIKGGSVQLN